MAKIMRKKLKKKEIDLIALWEKLVQHQEGDKRKARAIWDIFIEPFLNKDL